MNGLRALSLILLATALTTSSTCMVATAQAAPAANSASAPEQDEKFRPAHQNGIPDSYIVVLKTSSTAADSSQKRLLARHPGSVKHTYRSALNGFAVTMPEAVARRLSQDPDVEFVEQDAWGRGGTTQSNPPSWGLDRIDERAQPRDARYNYWTTGAGVHAYVLDSGIRRTHTDFGGRATSDADFVGDGQNGNDCLGHGTHVAGTIGGTVYGVAKGLRLHSVRVLNCMNYVAWSWAIAGLDWVRANAQRPAVVNMSLGGDPSVALDTAVTNTIGAGITVVTAAGNNNGQNACNYSPSRVPAAITVANANSADARYSTSNIGSCVDLFAPGTNIVSTGITSDTATATMTGTSMAAPHVTGTAAKFLQRNPTASPAQVTNSILNEATRDVITNAGSLTPNRLLFSDLAMTGHRVVTASFTVKPAEGWDTLVPCPTGTVVTGGGYFYGSTLGVEVDISAPRSTGWYVHAINTDSQAQSITAYAVCAQTPAQQIVTAQFNLAPGSATAVNAPCPTGKTIVGGGYWHDGSVGVAVTVSVPNPSQHVWHVEVVNSFSQPRTLLAYAVCTQTPGQEMVTSQFTVQPGQGWDTIARCPAGTAVTGGGYTFPTSTSPATFNVAIDMSNPDPLGGWHVHAYNADSTSKIITAYAMCAASR
jgi:hypothetical protein